MRSLKASNDVSIRQALLIGLRKIKKIRHTLPKNLWKSTPQAVPIIQFGCWNKERILVQGQIHQKGCQCFNCRSETEHCSYRRMPWPLFFVAVLPLLSVLGLQNEPFLAENCSPSRQYIPFSCCNAECDCVSASWHFILLL